MARIPLLKYLAALLLFGSNGIVASYILLPSYAIVFTRTLIGAVFLAAILAASRQPRCFGKHRRDSMYLLVSGVAMGVSWMFLFAAYTRIGVNVATLVYYSGPVIVVMLSPLLFGERLTAVKLAGFAAVLVGMLLMSPRAWLEGKPSTGLLYGVMSAVMYAAMVIFNKKAARITGLENATWQLGAAFVTVATYLVLRQGLSLHVAPGNWLPILFLGVVNTGIGCYLYFSPIARLPVQTVAIAGYLEPLSAVVFAALFLGETLSPAQLVGAVLILGGAACGDLRGRRRAAARS